MCVFNLIFCVFYKFSIWYGSSLIIKKYYKIHTYVYNRISNYNLIYDKMSLIKNKINQKLINHFISHNDDCDIKLLFSDSKPESPNSDDEEFSIFPITDIN